MLTLERDGRRSYSAALVARASDGRDRPGTLAELAGRSVAWVDPWSAAGYLVPRCMLRAAGIEPDRTFATQSFHGSYEGVMAALLGGAADVGAMSCRVGDQGEITAGTFRDDRRLRAMAVSIEPVPGDTICVSAALPVEDAREVVEQFIRTAASPAIGTLFRDLFGGDRFVAANASRYEGLEAALLEDIAADR
jgi:ABC-type phosphate/phosphonate transport system substrate-binding protein